MILSSLTLRQFRSHDQLTLRVNSGVNLFVGSNGAGKTNLIEAVAVLTTGVSPRGSDIESMIQWGTEGFAIVGVFSTGRAGDDPLTLEMKARQGESRQIRENGKTVVRLRGLIGKIPLVSFVPEDLALVKGEPELRRRAVNMVLMQVDLDYADALRRYQDALKSRNAALKQVWEGALSEDALDPWDAAIVSTGVVVCRARQAFVDEFSGRAALVHRRVSGGKETLALEYRPSVPGSWDQTGEQRWREALRQSRRHELAAGMTLSGPQRDDFLFSLDGRPAKAYASEGQTRTAAVAFKLAEIPYIQERRGVKPICLLDDVLSELDADRAAHLLDELSRTGQCFVTMTGLESWPSDRPQPATVFHVSKKGISEELYVSSRAAVSAAF